MIELSLTHNKGFTWNNLNNIWVKGAVCDKNGRQIRLGALLRILQSVHTIEDLARFVSELRGIFSIVIKRQNSILLASDITRTFPLFFCRLDGSICVADDINGCSSKLGKKVSTKSQSEFLSTGYTIGSKTIFEGVEQLQAAELIELSSNNTRAIEYWSYVKKRELSGTFSDFKGQAIYLIEQAADRLIKSLEGRTAVVPLSGGYDSRLILACLKKSGYDNILCFSYGDPMSQEVKIAKYVSHQLAIPFYPIDLKPKNIKEGFSSTLVEDYMKYAFNGVSVPHLQDFLAVKQLNERKIIDGNAVFIPGHSGDIFAGTHIDPKLREADGKNAVEKALISKHFRLSDNLVNFNADYYDESAPNYSNMEAWSWKERQSKFIINSLRTYEFFGYESRLPLWDYDLASFFRNVPRSYKNRREKKLYSIDTNLYDAACFSIFKKVGVPEIQRYADPVFVRAFRRVMTMVFSVDGINNLDTMVDLISRSNNMPFKSKRANGRLAEIQIQRLKARQNY
jgi:asparagine synthase (glutamine-hydrolysing)